MRTPRRRRRFTLRPAARRAVTLALVAALAATLAVADPVRGAGESLLHAAATAWNGVFGERPTTTAAKRMIVVLDEPSLADRIADAEKAPTRAQQKRWVREAAAAQRLLLARLAARGVEIRRERAFTRTVNGFSALVDARAQAELERTDGVAGVYPVRTLYPAGVTAETLARPEFRAGAGRRPDVALPAFDGRGVRVALLDSGVDREHPYLNGRVGRGVDLVDGDRRADAEPKPDDPKRLESHGTRMAGILVGSGGPDGLRGIVPAARVLPIRILGWERSDDGSFELLGRGDALLAGLERAVDPNRDGAVEDAVAVALAAVVEPYASFSDSPEARAVAGASRLGTLVVAPSGNDGHGGRGFGTVGAPGGAPEALAVGALDARAETLEARTTLRVGGETALDAHVRLLGAVPPSGRLPLAALHGPTLADPARPATEAADGTTLEDLFDPNGVSRVAGRAAVVSADGPLETKVRNAVSAGAAAVLVSGTVPAGAALDLEAETAIPVVSVPADAARAALDGLERGDLASVAFGDVRRVANPTRDDVAAFSSGGVAFGGHVKPDVVAPGVGVATADAGTDADGSPRYATVTGSSAAAAVVAASAAALAQARPDLAPAELRSVLVGTARQLVGDGVADPVTAQGAGAVDLAAAAGAEIAVEPVTLAFGRAGAKSRKWEVTQTVTVTNISTRRLDVRFGVTRDRPDGPEISFSALPATLSLGAGRSADVTLVASASGRREGETGGAFVVLPADSRPIRVPWAVSFRPKTPRPLLDAVALSHREFAASDGAPAVLAFRVGAVDSNVDGRAIEPVERLDAELRTAGGRRLGVLARLRDLLPGRYAFGVTGRGPAGQRLAPGDYVLRLRAHPVAGDVRARATTVDVPFTITGRD